MLDEAARVVRVGGLVVYSVCTLTSAETVGIDDWLMGAHPELEPEAAPPAPWRPHGRGSLLLPPVADTDGMALFLYRRIA